MTNKAKTTQELIAAAQISRRSLLKSGAVLGAAGLAAPFYVRAGFAAAGELNFMGWAGYDGLKPIFESFTSKTGIKVNFSEQPDNDTIFTQAKLALQTGAVDVLEPVLDRAQGYIENGLVQPWDAAKIKLDNYEQGLVTGQAEAMASSGGQRYFVPSVWGTEALVYNKDKMPQTYGTASLEELFSDQNAGKITVRAHSALAALGRVMDGKGQLPKPFLDGYKNDADMKQIWDVILAEAIKHKKNFVQFWKSENEAQAAFRTNGATLGLCWDSTGFNLGKEGPYGFIAPKEGAFAWNQGFMLMKNAKNIDSSIAWVNYIATPEGSAAYAKAFSANPAAKGAIELADPAVTAFYKAAYPGDALQKLWWWPSQSSSFVKLRNEYAEKFMAA